MANLEQIVRDLKSERNRLDDAIRALEAVSTNSNRRRSKADSPARAPSRRNLSAAARRKIAAAKIKGKKVIPIKTGKRHISEAGRARIAAAARARWAKVRAGKK